MTASIAQAQALWLYVQQSEETQQAHVATAEAIAPGAWQTAAVVIIQMVMTLVQLLLIPRLTNASATVQADIQVVVSGLGKLSTDIVTGA